MRFSIIFVVSLVVLLVDFCFDGSSLFWALFFVYSFCFSVVIGVFGYSFRSLAWFFYGVVSLLG